jgi:predicted RecB family nuclease
VIPERDAATVLIFQKGLEHERRYLASLKARGRNVVEVPGEGFDLPEQTALTREAIRAGAEIIYQAALVAPPWLGLADCLERIDAASNLGSWSYEAVDTKLPRRAKPEHVIQLAMYSKLIGNQQGRTPTVHVELGNGERGSLRVSDFAHYHSIAQRRLETFANRPPEISVGEPCGHCRICRWSDRCEADWEATDHLTLVARITRHQIRRLWEAGILTVRTLAALPAGSRVPGVHLDTLNRLRHQATLQTANRDTDAFQYSIPYLLSKVANVDLPSFLHGMTPMTEVTFNSQHNMNLVAPGFSYSRGRGWELGIEALIPTTRASGRGLGVIAQLLIELDYLLPDSFVGRPIFSPPELP